MSFRRLSFIALLPPVLLLMAATSHAAGITDITGSFDSGQQVVIRGSGFGTKANAKPLFFWDFGKSTTATSQLSRKPSETSIRGSIITSGVVAPGSSGALRVEMGGISQSAGPEEIHFSSDSAYIWVKRHYNFDAQTAGGSLNLKHVRFWYPWTHSTYVDYLDGTGVAFAEQTGESSVWYGSPHPKGQWYIDEFDYQTSGIGATDGILQYIRNGVSQWSFSQRWRFRTSAYSGRYSMIALDQVSNNRLPSGSYIYYDTVYVDDSRHRVIVSDEATWRETTSAGSAAKREIQVPIRWSDTEIEISVRKGSFPDFSDKYLYVIKADGKPVSTQGFKVCSNCGTVRPKIPTGFVVQ